MFKRLLIIVFVLCMSVPVRADIIGSSNLAEDVEIDDAGSYYTGTNVETALQEIGAGTVDIDTLDTVCDRGSTTNQSLIVEGAAGISIGKDVAAGTTNEEGILKLWSDGDNAFYTQIKTGTQTQTNVFTLPLDDGNADEILSTNGAGVLDWVAAGAASGDITDVGDCTTGAAFTADGTGNNLWFEGATADAFETILTAEDTTTADKTITLPNATGTVVLKDTTDTLTNKTLAAADNVIEADTCVGNAGTVTNATLTTALTVDTGTVGLTGNVANTSVLTLGAGASSISGANTGDNTVATSGDSATDFFSTGEIADAQISNTLTSSTCTGNAATVSTIAGLAPDTATTQASQPNITSLGTLTGLTVGVDAVGTAQTVGESLINASAAASAAQQYSPVFELEGQGWKTDATAGSQEVKWGLQTRPVEGAANPTGVLDILSSINAGAYAAKATLTSGGVLTATTFSGALSGNATTATTLATPRAINGVNFDGSAPITVTADANTLSGTTLKSTVVTSSLTAVGTLTDLAVTNTITGSISGQAGTVATIAGLAPNTQNTYARTQYLIPYASTTTAFGEIAIGTSGQVLTSGGAGVAPSFAAAPSVSGWTDGGTVIYPTTATDNVCIGGTTDAGTGGQGVLVIKNGTAPTTSPADVVQLYAVDALSGYTADQIPTMTAASTPSGEASASSANSTNYAWKAFDKDTATCWQAGGYVPQWLQYDFGSTKTIVRYSIRVDTYAGEMPKTWTFKASNTGAFTGEEVTLDTQTDITWASSETKQFTFANSTAYRYYRLNITAVGDSADYGKIYELAMMEGTYSSELAVRDESGNVTNLSPHNFKNIPKEITDKNKQDSDNLAWTYHSEKDGKEITVDMFRSIQLLEKLTGEKLIYTNDEANIVNRTKIKKNDTKRL